MLKAFVKKGVVSEVPYKRNLRTAPQFIIVNERDFEAEKTTLVDYIKRTQELGTDHFYGKENMSFGAMLLAFIVVIYSLNWILVDGIGAWTGLNAFVISTTNGVFDGFSLQYIPGQLFRVFVFIMGVEWAETLQVGSLIGQKTLINEFVAYLSLSDLMTAGELSEKSIVISTYVLCGFANFSSIAIQIGDIGSLAPNPQGGLSKLGLKALMAATLATMMTAIIAGALFG